MIKDAGSKYDYSILPKIRWIVLHWGYELTEKDFSMSFVIRDDMCLNKYNEIWNKIKVILSIKFHRMSV